MIVECSNLAPLCSFDLNPTVSKCPTRPKRFIAQHHSQAQHESTCFLGRRYLAETCKKCPELIAVKMRDSCFVISTSMCMHRHAYIYIHLIMYIYTFNYVYIYI